jgi:co-chaperonin GroES (HSP10)
MNTIDRAAFMALDPRKMKPHGDRIIVEKVEVENVHVIPGMDTTIEIAGGDGDLENARGYFLGRVLAVGNGHRLEADVTVPMPFAVGQVWLIERFSGREIVLGGKKYRVVNQVDVFCYVPELDDYASDDGREDRYARELLDAAVA